MSHLAPAGTVNPTVQHSIADDAHCSIDVARSAQAILDVLSPVAVGVVGVEDGVGGGGVLAGVWDDVLAGGLLVGDGGTAQQARVCIVCDTIVVSIGLVRGPAQLSPNTLHQHRKTSQEAQPSYACLLREYAGSLWWMCNIIMRM